MRTGCAMNSLTRSTWWMSFEANAAGSLARTSVPDRSTTYARTPVDLPSSSSFAAQGRERDQRLDGADRLLAVGRPDGHGEDEAALGQRRP